MVSGSGKDGVNAGTEADKAGQTREATGATGRGAEARMGAHGASGAQSGAQVGAQPGEALAARAADRLAGQILVAMPSLADPAFAQAVILLCAHGEDGAMGLVLNRPVPSLTFATLLRQLEILPAPPERELRLCAGGPVETTRGFVLHSKDWMAESSLPVAGDFALTSSLDILKALAEGGGPRTGLLALGYAGWGPGQLEAEIADNAWLSIAADEALIFDADNESRWHRAMAKMHITPAALSPAAGHA
ncbi:YqgE/AlgH family protein [Acidisoma sp. C75]